MTVSQWEITALGFLAAALVGACAWVVLDQHVTPEKMERVRRRSLSRRGRLADGTITEAGQETIYYSYSIHGVAYTASQDISNLYKYMAANPERLIGPVSLKYSPNNPADSIVICEQWSGLRKISGEGERVNA